MNDIKKSAHIVLLKNLLRVINSDNCDINHGLCLNYRAIIYHQPRLPHLYFEIVFKDLIESWKHYSGDVMYPIPSGDKKIISPARQYWHGNLWEGKQRELRIDLVNHIITELEKTL